MIELVLNKTQQQLVVSGKELSSFYQILFGFWKLSKDCSQQRDIDIIHCKTKYVEHSKVIIFWMQWNIFNQI